MGRKEGEEEARMRRIESNTVRWVGKGEIED